ncbi:polysaccharide biosynthesis C-terminal domain-containing protein [Dysgonomonas macrotermitis]|uniref:UDP-2-acetamido-2,6-beta-L-arabino-hexul-4-ose reductase n=1 Tax=Dysgonomonas macrotermitis TaxID=1346286 RepID=A0A1M5I4F2_9BACT|nr:NAD-dependent epimerase/dehydratase family protein [Dysgonomonas macrotermitis]SHG23155.1 UDP-2-acetamido-2,6-beta-L-arabino-hexul-4-ose reductase [Dysgonomonas macrotermitis]
MIKIGITGQAGFVGTHLFNELGLLTDSFERILFEDAFFENSSILDEFVQQCDVIVHLAAVNRHNDIEVLYETNISLCKLLIDSCERTNSKPYILFSSSTQEELDNLYGKSKKEGRTLFEQWAKKNCASFTGLVVPNVFGPFGKPNYNSFIATFSYKLTHGEEPTILTDSPVKLIYVGSLCKFIINKVNLWNETVSVPCVEEVAVPFDFERSVSEILDQLRIFAKQYFNSGIIPYLSDRNDINIFNTFRSYIDYSTYFPFELVKHSDDRGIFVETIKLGLGGQVSFSTTKEGVTRGNHYHSRKIERFTVIKGKARIQLRKIGTNEVLNFVLDGENPSYVDMPIWYTHNITNIGKEDLYTQFWINEWYDSNDGDTFSELVNQ